ncbi:MAG: hypothetical protein U0521_27535 [Anaerolineae bacterium]
MAFEVYWDSREQRLLVLELSQTVTWEEFMEGVRETHEMSETTIKDLTLVVWAKAAFPEGLALWRLSSVFRSQPGNIRRTIIVVETSNPLLALAKRLAGIVRDLYPTKSRIYFADSMEAARALSAPADALLPLK